MPDKSRGKRAFKGRAGAMGGKKLAAYAFVGALALVAGCTTGPIDGMETTAIAPVTQDISATDLDEGEVQFRSASYGLAEKHFRQAAELRADNAEAWIGLAASYDELGRFDFAARAY